MIWKSDDKLDHITCELLKIHQELLLRICLSGDTSSDHKNWLEEEPSWGQSAAIALIVHQQYGGEILYAPLEGIEGYEKLGFHYWNRLPEGTEVDLAADQFSGNDRSLLPKGQVISEERILRDPDFKKSYQHMFKKFDLIVNDCLKLIALANMRRSPPKI